MRNIIAFLKEHVLLLILIFLMVVIGWRMTQTYWAFVDDGEMIEVSQRMNSTLPLILKGDILEWLKDPQVGRFRPTYWLFHYVVYLIFHLNRFGHGLAQILLVWTTTIICYLTARKINRSNIAGFLAGVLFIANTLNQENWYRLGPQEAPLIFFFSLTAYLLILYLNKNFAFLTSTLDLRRINKSFFVNLLQNSLLAIKDLRNVFTKRDKKGFDYFIYALLFTFLGYFTKENSPAFLVFPILIFLWFSSINSKKIRDARSKLMFYLIFSLAMALMARFGALKNYQVGSYASDYIFSLSNIKSNLTYFTFNIWITFEPIILMVLIYVAAKFLQFLGNRKLTLSAYLSMVFLITFGSFFVIQLPWRYAIPRYLLPAMYFYAVFTGLVLDRLISVLKNANKNDFFKLTGLNRLGKTLIYIVWFLIITVVTYNLAMMAQYITRVYNLTNNFNRPLIATLAEKVGTSGRVILDTPPGTALELKQEIGLHLRLFYNRPDIKVEYWQYAGKLTEGDVLLRAGEFKQVTNNSSISTKDLGPSNRIDIHVENKLYYPPMQFIKNYLPSVIFSLIQGHSFAFNPVLSASSDNYYWDIYKLNPSK